MGKDAAGSRPEEKDDTGLEYLILCMPTLPCQEAPRGAIMLAFHSYLPTLLLLTRTLPEQSFYPLLVSAGLQTTGSRTIYPTFKKLESVVSLWHSNAKSPERVVRGRPRAVNPTLLEELDLGADHRHHGFFIPLLDVRDFLAEP